MNFTAAEWVLIIGAIALGVQNAINAWRQSTKIGKVKTISSEIAHSVNGVASLAKAEADSKQEHIKMLQSTIAEMKQQAALLAQASLIGQVKMELKQTESKQTETK